MSLPSPSKPPPQTPPSATTSAKTRKITFQEPRDLIAANALVQLATTNTMNNNRAFTPAATNADSGNTSITADLSKHIDNMEDYAGKVTERGARKIVVLKLPPRFLKNVEEKQSEESVKIRKDSARDPRELMAANALVGLATKGIVVADKTSAPLTGKSSGNEIRNAKTSKRVDTADSAVKARRDSPAEPRKPMATKALVGSATSGIVRSKEASKLSTEADLQSQHIALRLHRGEFRVSDDALKFLERGVRAFILDLFKKHKRQGSDNPIKKAQQRILAGKCEADRRKKQQEFIKDNLPAMLERLKDAIEEKKEPNESEELRLMREAMIRATVAMYEDIFKTTTDLKDAVRRLEKEIASHEDIFGPGGDLETDYLFFVYGPLEKDEGKQSEGLVRTQQWVLLEDSGWDRRTRRKLAGQARLTPEFALREGASVLEFTFGQTADVERPAGGGGDKAIIPEEQHEIPQPPAVMPSHQHHVPPGAMRPLVQNEAWQARFNGLIERTHTETSTQKPPLPPKPVAAARKAVNNVKPEGPPTDVQHTTAQKLDVPTAPTTTTATTDEGLASALPDIDIFKGERPNTTAPKPPHQPPPGANSIPTNPFYRPDMTLAIAAQNIVAYFREAADWLNFWHISTSASTLVDMSHKPTSTLRRIFRHLRWTAGFLRFGHAGWDLRCLPDNFFQDVLPLIMVTCGKLEKLGELKGCEGMMNQAWKDAEEAGEMLATVWNLRARDDKEGIREDGIWDKIL
ncbi:hypothetical protein MBLNU13_g01084t1 [Cladosporium sp. NU13]